MWFNPQTNFALTPRTIPIDTALENFSYFAIFTRSSMVEQTTPTMHLIYATWRGGKKTHAKMLQVWSIHHLFTYIWLKFIVHVGKYCIHGAFSGMVGWLMWPYHFFGFRCMWVFQYLGGRGGEVKSWLPKKMMWNFGGLGVVQGFETGDLRQADISRFTHENWKQIVDAHPANGPTFKLFWGIRYLVVSRKNKSSNFHFMIFWLSKDVMSQLLCYFRYTENPS